MRNFWSDSTPAEKAILAVGGIIALGALLVIATLLYKIHGPIF